MIKAQIRDKKVCEVSIFTLGLTDFYKKYKSPDDEASIMKNIPNTEENRQTAKLLVNNCCDNYKNYSRIRYRGPSIKDDKGNYIYHRPVDTAHPQGRNYYSEEARREAKPEGRCDAATVQKYSTSLAIYKRNKE